MAVPHYDFIVTRKFPVILSNHDEMPNMVWFDNIPLFFGLRALAPDDVDVVIAQCKIMVLNERMYYIAFTILNWRTTIFRAYVPGLLCCVINYVRLFTILSFRHFNKHCTLQTQTKTLNRAHADFRYLIYHP